MTKGAYSRKRIKDVLTKAKLPPSSRITPHRYLETPLGVAPGDSRFCSKADGFTALYTSPEFATAFILNHHIHFVEQHDFSDIEKMDIPAVMESVQRYGRTGADCLNGLIRGLVRGVASLSNSRQFGPIGPDKRA